MKIKIKNSKKPSHVEKVAAVLADGRWHSSHELYRRTESVVHSRVSDLRRKGWTIEHDRLAGGNGPRYHRYRATSKP